MINIQNTVLVSTYKCSLAPQLKLTIRHYVCPNKSLNGDQFPTFLNRKIKLNRTFPRSASPF